MRSSVSPSDHTDESATDHPRQSSGLARRTFLGAGLSLLAGGAAARPRTARKGTPTRIDSCTTISAPGEYVLTSDLQPDTVSGAACLEITANDVVLDGNGHTIDGSLTGDEHRGVASTTLGRSNVTIRNLRVHGWKTGIDFKDLVDGTFQNIHARDNPTGLAVSGGNVRIERSTFTSSGIDIGGLGGHQGTTNAFATISHTDVTDTSGPGIDLFGGGNADIQYSRLVANTHGIEMGGRYTADVTLRSTVLRNSNYGIRNRDTEETAEFPAFEDVVDARKNYWGAPTGPSSPDDRESPLTDPKTGRPADGAGDVISEGLTPGVANVRFDPPLKQAPSNARQTETSAQTPKPTQSPTTTPPTTESSTTTPPTTAQTIVTNRTTATDGLGFGGGVAIAGIGLGVWRHLRRE